MDNEYNSMYDDLPQEPDLEENTVYYAVSEYEDGRHIGVIGAGHLFTERLTSMLENYFDSKIDELSDISGYIQDIWGGIRTQFVILVDDGEDYKETIFIERTFLY